jgi:hypothetical protein
MPNMISIVTGDDYLLLPARVLCYLHKYRFHLMQFPAPVRVMMRPGQQQSGLRLPFGG